jgi:hypothetical protein
VAEKGRGALLKYTNKLGLKGVGSGEKEAGLLVLALGRETWDQEAGAGNSGPFWGSTVPQCTSAPPSPWSPAHLSARRPAALAPVHSQVPPGPSPQF